MNKIQSPSSTQAFNLAEALAQANTPCKLYKEAGLWWVEWNDTCVEAVKRKA